MILTMSIDNFTILSTYFEGKEKNINLTLKLASVSYSLSQIDAKIVVELVTCTDRPGYAYDEESRVCICYHAC